MSEVINIAGYRFVFLDALPELRIQLLDQCLLLALKGSILLSEEGINIFLAGSRQAIHDFKLFLNKDHRFLNMRFHESVSDAIPFKRMKVKIKKEIITMRQPNVQPAEGQAPTITPDLLKQWLDEKRDFTLLDTRNEYELAYGTFENAINPHVDDFSEFPKVVNELDSKKPVVMFCTGGIRCEKASLYLLQNGFSQVYQLEGGILNYFSKVGGAHYSGSCFVFDERVALDSNLLMDNSTMPAEKH